MKPLACFQCRVFECRLFAGALIIILALGALGRALAADDILIADFERADYGEWRVEGTAFGPGPAQGTLPGQMNVTGYRGERLVNSFFDGDRSTGMLTSPAFPIQRDYLTFLIGGGGHGETTCMRLLVNGATVRIASGPNTEAGGAEELTLAAWDVRQFKGQSATLQIVDRATGGWGHINIDHIIQTDQKPALPIYAALEKTFTVERQHLILPIKNGAKSTEIVLEIDGQPVRRYHTELATQPDAVDWHAFFTIDSYRGRAAKVRAAQATEAGFALIRQADQVPGSERWYTETLRPQFHFSQNVGWNNDPNGLLYLDGEWHLFFQHNPVGWKWGNMTWGHAVSRDLIHWEQLPDALFPKTMMRGDAFSGGGTVDVKNTAGWKTGTHDVLVVFLTDTGAGESVAYSNDRGRTFTWYEGNPVVQHRGRDPKVIWYSYRAADAPLNARAQELGGHWVMAVYDEHEQLQRNIAFYTSTNLKEWELQSHLPGYYECPELFELPVDRGAGRSRWVIFGADAQYALGSFDGRRFVPEHEGKYRVHWGEYYASQTFENAPDGRRIQIGWARIAMPGMPFNQTFSFPHELSLGTTEDGIRLFAKPIREIEKIHRKKHALPPRALNPDAAASLPVGGELFDVRATFELGAARRVGLNIGGNRIVYDVARAELGKTPLQPAAGRISLQVLIDRPMIEICANEGRAFITQPREHRGNVAAIEAFAEEGSAQLVSLEVFELNSIWRQAQR